MDLLWPELGRDAAAANLRKAVHFARQALGPSHVGLRDELLSLDAARLWIDVDAFERAVQIGDRPAALELYTDDLLVEDPFEPWTQPRREQLRVGFARLLLDWGRELAGSGDLSRAATVFARLVALDPLNEDAVTGLMRAHADAGERHLALRAYQQLATRLDDELGVAPAAQARECRDRIAAGQYPPAERHPTTEQSPGTGPASPGPLAEERKLVTALSLDVVIPPAATDPEWARIELDRCAGVVTEILESWDATVERLPGGTVLAVFGIPRIHEDDAGRAIRAALELRERSPLVPRIGVGTGEVITAGEHDAGLRQVVGEALDAASRLREAAAPGTVLVTERTRRAAGAGFRYGDPVRLPSTGGAELVARPAIGWHGESAGDRRSSAPMVGRDAELAVIHSLFAEVLDSGQPRLVTVVGPAGIGKTPSGRRGRRGPGHRASGPDRVTRSMRAGRAGKHLRAAGRHRSRRLRNLYVRPTRAGPDQMRRRPARQPRPGRLEHRGGRGHVRPGRDLRDPVAGQQPGSPRTACGRRRAGPGLAPVPDRLQHSRAGAGAARGPALGRPRTGRDARADDRPSHRPGPAASHRTSGGSGQPARARRRPAGLRVDLVAPTDRGAQHGAARPAHRSAATRPTAAGAGVGEGRRQPVLPGGAGPAPGSGDRDIGSGRPAAAAGQLARVAGRPDRRAVPGREVGPAARRRSRAGLLARAGGARARRRAGQVRAGRVRAGRARAGGVWAG